MSEIEHVRWDCLQCVWYELGSTDFWYVAALGAESDVVELH